MVSVLLSISVLYGGIMKKIVTAIALCASFNALADWDSYGGLGINLNTYKEDLPNQYELEDDQTLGLTAGWKTVGRWGNIGFRTGAFFEYARVSVDDKLGTNPNIELKSYYAAIPLNLQFDVIDSLSIFGGLTPRILLAKTCEDCGEFDDDGTTFVNYTNFGVTWNFSRNWSADFVFNHAIQENYENIKINTAQALLFYKF